jgi:hypothetical protein
MLVIDKCYTNEIAPVPCPVRYRLVITVSADVERGDPSVVVIVNVRHERHRIEMIIGVFSSPVITYTGDVR